MGNYGVISHIPLPPQKKPHRKTNKNNLKATSNKKLKRKIFEFLLCKQLQKEANEFKMAAQKLEGHLRHTSDLLEQKQHELQLTQARREELEREMGKVMGRIEVLESQESHKVGAMGVCAGLFFFKIILLNHFFSFFAVFFFFFFFLSWLVSWYCCLTTCFLQCLFQESSKVESVGMMDSCVLFQLLHCKSNSRNV